MPTIPTKKFGMPTKVPTNGADSGLMIWLPTKTLIFVPWKLQEHGADSGLMIWLPTKTLIFVPWKLWASKIYVQVKVRIEFAQENDAHDSHKKVRNAH